jgi:hypothetical protein
VTGCASLYKEEKQKKLMLNRVIIRKYINEIYMGSNSRECRNRNNEIDDNNGKYKKVTIRNGTERGFRILTTQRLSTIATPPQKKKKKTSPKKEKHDVTVQKQIKKI